MIDTNRTSNQTNPHNIPPSLPVEQEWDYASIALKTLVVAAAAIAGAALGFYVASIAGLCIGAAAGGAIGFGATWLNSCSAETQGTPPIQPQHIFKDKTLKWITGTQSQTLALMLAVHRQGKIRDLANAPALIPEKLLLSRGIALITGDEKHKNEYTPELSKEYLTIKGTHAQAPVNRAFFHAKEPIPPFNFDQTLENAYTIWTTQIWGTPTIPGKKSAEEIGFELKMFEISIVRLLQAGLDESAKNQLKAIIQNDVIPIFASRETFKEYVSTERLNEWLDRPYQKAQYPNTSYYDVHYDRLRPIANRLLALFDQVEPLILTPGERDLVDNPCPLIFASTNLVGSLIPEPFPSRLQVANAHMFPRGPSEESAIHEPALLGHDKDLQYIYTTAENIDRINHLVEPFNIEVRDIETL